MIHSARPERNQMLTNHPKILTLLTFIGFVMLLFPGNAAALKVNVICDGGSYCDGRRFAYIGLKPGEVVEDAARVINFGDETIDILVCHRQESQNSGCGISISPSKCAAEISGVAAWIDAPDYNGLIEPDKDIVLPFTLTVPEDAASGGYGAGFVAQEKSDDSGSGGVSLLFANAISIYISVAGVAERIGQGTYHTVHFLDIDDDGDLDRFDGPALFRNDDGVFNKVTDTYDGMSESLYFADIDDDGQAEMFTVEWPRTIKYFENQGTLMAPDWRLIDDAWLSQERDYISGMVFHDIDKDGDIDLFLTSMWSKIYYFENTGNPQSPSWSRASDDYIGESTDFPLERCPRGLAFMDIDGDGIEEMLLGGDMAVELFKRDPDVQDIKWIHHPDALDFLGVDVNNQPAVADVDGDGTEELYVMSQYGLYRARDLDNPPRIANPIQNLSIDEDAEDAVIDLSSVFTDDNDDDAAIIKTLASNDNPSLIDVKIDGDALTLAVQHDQYGAAEIIVRGASNEKTVDATFTVTVKGIDDPPVIASPIEDITVDEDAPDTVIDLTGVFADIDHASDEIVKTVDSNDNPALVTPTVSGDALTLAYIADQNGTAVIGVGGTAGGKTVTDEFTVTVRSVLDLPPPPKTKPATGVTPSGFTANWEASMDAASYRLDVSETADFNSFVSGYEDLDVSETSREVADLKEGSEYFYRVRAENTVGTSQSSSVIGVKTHLRANIDGAGGVDLNDLIAVLKILAGITPVEIRSDYALSAVDVNGDDVVGYEELFHIMKSIAGIH